MKTKEVIMLNRIAGIVDTVLGTLGNIIITVVSILVGIFVGIIPGGESKKYDPKEEALRRWEREHRDRK